MTSPAVSIPDPLPVADRRRRACGGHAAAASPRLRHAGRSAARGRAPRRPDGDRFARQHRHRRDRGIACRSARRRANGPIISPIATASSGRYRRVSTSGRSSRKGSCPARAGLIVADRYDAAVMREAATVPLPAPTRNKCTLRLCPPRGARGHPDLLDPERPSRLSRASSPPEPSPAIFAAPWGFGEQLGDLPGSACSRGHNRAPTCRCHNRRGRDWRFASSNWRTMSTLCICTARISGVSPPVLASSHWRDT